MIVTLIDALREAGLLDGVGTPHLTDKGRDWLRALEDVHGDEVVEQLDGAAADLVLSTSGLFR